MIAGMTREVRFVLTTAAIVTAAVVGFYLLGRTIGDALEHRPYRASIVTHLRGLKMGQAAYRANHASYTTEVMRVWQPPADSTARGIRLRILTATADGYIAEGRSDYWSGKCVLAVGPVAGDSLRPGEP